LLVPATAFHSRASMDASVVTVSMRKAVMP
jgi:hypothetical protein